MPGQRSSRSSGNKAKSRKYAGLPGFRIETLDSPADRANRTVLKFASLEQSHLTPPAIAPMIREGFPALRDGIGQGSIRRFVGEILFASEEADERPALQGAVIANGAAEHRIARLQGIQNGALGNWALDFKLDFISNLGKSPQMERQRDADHAWPAICVEKLAFRQIEHPAD